MSLQISEYSLLLQFNLQLRADSSPPSSLSPNPRQLPNERPRQIRSAPGVAVRRHARGCSLVGALGEVGHTLLDPGAGARGRPCGSPAPERARVGCLASRECGSLARGRSQASRRAPWRVPGQAWRVSLVAEAATVNRRHRNAVADSGWMRRQCRPVADPLEETDTAARGVRGNSCPAGKRDLPERRRTAGHG